MMHGNLNTDKLCRPIEQILNERDENIEYKVSLIDKDNEATKDSNIEAAKNEL